MNKLRAWVTSNWKEILTISAGLLAMVVMAPYMKTASDGLDSKQILTAPAPAPLNLPAPLSKSEKLQKETFRVVTLSARNTVALRGPVMSETVTKLEQQLIQLSHTLPKTETIYLVLDTPGGEVDSGMKLIDTIAGLPQKVKTITIFAASMGFHIVEHLDSRMILPSGILMSHRAAGGVDGQMPGEAVTRLNFFLTTLEDEDRFVAGRIGIPFEKYREMIHDEYWASGSHAVQQKVADEVVLARCDKDLNGIETLGLTIFFIPVTVTFSRCPLISAPLKVELGGKVSPEKAEKVHTFLDTMIKDRKRFVHEYIVNGRLPEYVR